MKKKSYAKVNIFLKIAGKRENYHELVSRFCRVKSLFDIIEFIPASVNEFTLEGKFGCDTEKNTIYKAYKLLSKVSPSVQSYFKKHKIAVDKTIPEFAGLGGGSSNCATFMIMVNEACNLGFSKDELATLGAQIGADVPFFIYEYDSANVTGIGEAVEKFDEEILDIKTFTPNIKCDTGIIFKNFRDRYYKEITNEEATRLLKMKSIDIYNTFTIFEANDLYAAALKTYPTLVASNYNLPKNSFFSGSGSSFFYINCISSKS